MYRCAPPTLTAAGDRSDSYFASPLELRRGLRERICFPFEFFNFLSLEIEYVCVCVCECVHVVRCVGVSSRKVSCLDSQPSGIVDPELVV